MSFMDSLRRTGRTTRMLDEAAALARGGQNVVVVCADFNHRELLVRRFAKETGSSVDAKGCVPLNWGSVQFVSRGERAGLDWKRMDIIGTRGPTLFDHYAIECEFPGALAMLHRYDNPTPERSE